MLMIYWVCMILMLYSVFTMGKRADGDQMGNMSCDPMEAETQS